MLEGFSERSCSLKRKKCMGKKLEKETKVKNYKKQHIPHLIMKKKNNKQK